MIKVKELIEMLSKMNQDAYVYIEHPGLNSEADTRVHDVWEYSDANCVNIGKKIFHR